MIAHAMDSPPVRDDAARRWDVRRADKLRRLQAVGAHVRGKRADPAAIVAVLEGLLRPGDRVALEGDNQKQADFLSRALVQVDPARVHDLHLLISSISRPEHLTLFERGIARQASISPTPGRRACASRSCSRTASSRSARSTPTSSCTHGCSST